MKRSAAYEHHHRDRYDATIHITRGWHEIYHPMLHTPFLALAMRW